MSAFSLFAVSTGALWCGLAVISAWQFRTSTAPLALKLALPVALVGVSIYSPFAFREQLGRPIPTTFAAMPDDVTLLAFKPVEAEANVDLWIAEGAGTRAYEIPLDSITKQALRAAEGELGKGRPVVLSKIRRKGNGDSPLQSLTDLVDKDHPGFELNPKLQPALPPK